MTSTAPNASTDLILSLSKDEVVARPVDPPSWFDALTMRALGDSRP